MGVLKYVKKSWILHRCNLKNPYVFTATLGAFFIISRQFLLLLFLGAVCVDPQWFLVFSCLKNCLFLPDYWMKRPRMKNSAHCTGIGLNHLNLSWDDSDWAFFVSVWTWANWRNWAWPGITTCGTNRWGRTLEHYSRGNCFKLVTIISCFLSTC